MVNLDLCSQMHPRTLRLDQVFGLIQNDIITRRRPCGTPLLGDELHVS
uniref:Uncharacterized protein n=1 Tax=Setaria viridis TaxID=4556 RepID=A0A4U6VJA3_SETVI|nr:hypothetical protein SEVIR_3G415433v2 [Setaria viridis]